MWGRNVYFSWIFIARNVLGHTYELITRKAKFFFNTKYIAIGSNSLGWQRSEGITVSYSNLRLRKTKEKTKPSSAESMKWAVGYQWGDHQPLVQYSFLLTHVGSKMLGFGPCNDFFSKRSTIKAHGGPFQLLWALGHEALILTPLWFWSEIWLHFSVLRRYASVPLQGKCYSNSLQDRQLLLEASVCTEVPQKEKCYKFKI